jgi:geranylgeranyl diphosphate synthase type II
MTDPVDIPPPAPDFDLAAYLKIKRFAVNEFLENLLQDTSAPPRIVAAMHYSVTAGGKRLRPILCLAAAEAVGGRSEDALYAGCALELIHTYSLIHDDLPVMDDDALRRGKPTCHVAFDEATALLAGDALLTLAFEVLSRDRPDIRPGAADRLRVIQTIARAAGCQGMIGGQMLDISAEGSTLSRPELERMHRLKTGALIDAAVVAGAILGGGDSIQIQQLKRYAGNIGLAFQIMDDILNVEGDPALLGKAVGTDQDRQKTTYPSLLGLPEAKALAAEIVDNALMAIDIFDKKSEPLKSLARYIIQRRR